MGDNRGNKDKANLTIFFILAVLFFIFTYIANQEVQKHYNSPAQAFVFIFGYISLLFFIYTSIIAVTMVGKLRRHNTYLLGVGGIFLSLALFFSYLVYAVPGAPFSMIIIILGFWISFFYFTTIAATNAKRNFPGIGQIEFKKLKAGLFATGFLSIIISILSLIYLLDTGEPLAILFLTMILFIPHIILSFVYFGYANNKNLYNILNDKRFYRNLAAGFSINGLWGGIFLIDSQFNLNNIFDTRFLLASVTIIGFLAIVKAIYVPKGAIGKKSTKKEKPKKSVKKDFDVPKDISKSFKETSYVSPSILYSRLNSIKSENPNVIVNDIQILLDKNNVMEAEKLLKTREEQLNKFNNSKTYLEDLNNKINRLSVRLAEGDIDSDTYTRAYNDLESQKKDHEEQIFNIRRNLFKEEYEKPF